jgi:hypothetical protein
MEPFPVVNYELKLEMRLESGKEARLHARCAGSSNYWIRFHAGKITAERTHSDSRYRKHYKSVNCNTGQWHRLHVQSLGSGLRVTLDEKHVLISLNNVPHDHQGFHFTTHEGRVAIRNAEARLLR